MAARPRARPRREWPTGLHESRPGYFVWFNPVAKKYVAIGRVTLADARLQAIEANLWASEQLGKARLIDRLQQKDKTVREWLKEWIGELTLAENTLKSYRAKSKAINEEMGDLALGRLTVKDTANALDEIKKKRGAPTAQVARSVLISAFGNAITKGHMETNPALVTEAKKTTVARQRFTTATFEKVWAGLQDGPPWLRNATLLAMITGLRREDIAGLKFTDVADDYLLVAPKKSQGMVKIAIPLALYSEAMKMSLKDAIAVCRRTGVVSQYMVHQTEHTGRSSPGQRMSLSTVTMRFSEYVAKALGEGENLPTFHELRSLCKRSYQAQGGVDTKALLGHLADSSADLYENNRGAEFKKVKIG
uniref:Integrase family protein n=1 Tax=Variovorax paradoxus (strain S110) TaxID=543728 RepID=C5CJJ9_VARPS